MILVSGSGVPPHIQRQWKYEQRARAHGLNQTERGWVMEILEKTDQFYRTGEGEAQVLAQIDRIKHELWFQTTLGADFQDMPDTLNAWFPNWNYPADLDLDTLPILEEIDAPVLFIFGDDDAIWPVSFCVTQLERVFSESKGSKDWKILSFPKANHQIHTPQEFFDPRYFRSIGAWLDEKMAVR